MDVSLAAYFLFALADVVIYAGLFWVLKSSFKRHKTAVIGFILFTAPFVYLLANSKSIVDILWTLFFTPFYGLLILAIVFPYQMSLYYILCFGGLAIFHLISRRNSNTESPIRS